AAFQSALSGTFLYARQGSLRPAVPDQPGPLAAEGRLNHRSASQDQAGKRQSAARAGPLCRRARLTSRSVSMATAPARDHRHPCLLARATAFAGQLMAGTMCWDNVLGYRGKLRWAYRDGAGTAAELPQTGALGTGQCAAPTSPWQPPITTGLAPLSGTHYLSSFH